MRRPSISRPTQLALAGGLLSPTTEFFDYGCGRGDDVGFLQQLGISAAGWDPVHRPDVSRKTACVVNLGYVINVIEDAQERAATLMEAWRLTKRLLVVSARLINEVKDEPSKLYRDGLVTKAKTFQKYYEQDELRRFIEGVLHEQPVAAAPGIFYVFRDGDWKEDFLASRVRTRPSREKISATLERFSAHREVLLPLIEFLEQRGRLPDRHEEFRFVKVIETFGSLRKAYRLVVRAMGEGQWAVATEERANDLLVYLALSRFGGRPRRKLLPPELTSDVRAFFGTYHRACKASDDLLFQAGKRDALDEAFRVSTVGKRTQSALYVHRRAVQSLPPLLRVFEGCARTLVGEVDGANVVKLYRDSPRVSYLSYPDFEADPHPALYGSLLVHLQSFRVSYRDYATSDNPPILHRKEDFITREDADYAKFSALTAEEEKAELYADPQAIGTRQSWQSLLEALNLCIVDHRVLRSSQ
jgi:DNA phosphorothioation-associated putative methyltransferase